MRNHTTRARHVLTTAATLIAALALVACGDDDGGTPDSGRPDSGTIDGGGGAPDAGDTPDSGGSDAGSEPMARGRDNPPTIGEQIDRVGRPAISTALIGTFTPDTMRAARRDAYTAADDPAMWRAEFGADVAASLGVLDALDGTCGNQVAAGPAPVAGRYMTLAGALASDRLVVNAASGANGGNLYLGVEAETLGVLPPGMGGAGGRRPTDDVIERSYSALAAGALGGVDDTITMDDGDSTNTTFPFLGAPTAAE